MEERDNEWIGALRDVLVVVKQIEGNPEMPVIRRKDSTINVRRTVLEILPLFGVDVSNVEI
jgi:hypothetical protein